MEIQSAIIGEEGDIRMKWNPDSPWEVAEARRKFDELKKQKKYMAHKVVPGGQNQIMHEFDPSARMIVFSPIPVGG